MRVASPAIERRPRGVVIGIVVARNRDRLSRRHVAVVLFLQRARVVFEMVEDVERAVAGILDKAGADLVGAQQRDKPRRRVDLVLPHLGPAADRDQQVVGKAAQVGRGGGKVLVPETAEGLFGQHMLGHPVEMVDHRHPAPAHAEGGMDVGLRPVEDLAQLVPVGDGLEIQMLDRRAGDDQPVELLARHLAERAVERRHVLGGGVAGLVPGHPDQLEVDLQGCRADQPGELVLGLDLLRHQVQKPDPERPDILRGRAVGRHHHHALAVQHVEGGQVGGQGDRHRRFLPGGRLT